MKNILVFLAPSEREDPGLDQAVSIVAKAGGVLTLVDVLRRPREDARRLFDLKPGLEETLSRPLLERLEDTAASVARRADIRVAVKLLVGQPAIAIAKEAESGDYDLVVRTSSPDDVSSAFLATTALRLIRLCARPLLVVQPRSTIPVQRVLAAVDLGDKSREAVAAAVVRQAQAFAELHASELHIVHAADLAPLDGPQWTLPSHAVNAWRRSVIAARTSALRDLLATLNVTVPRERIAIVPGSATNMIIERIEDENIDLVVLGRTLRESPEAIMGSAAERILRRLRCSVLTVPTVASDSIAP